MPTWRVFSNIDAAEAAVSRMEASLAGPGAERTAIKAADVMARASREAFVGQADPRTGALWAEPADATIMHRHRPWLGLLGGPRGRIAGAIRSGYALTPGGARAFLNVEADMMKIAMIQLYGGRGKSKSAKARARSSRSLGRMGVWSLPGRRFIGVSQSAFDALKLYAEQTLLGNTNV